MKINKVAAAAVLSVIAAATGAVAMSTPAHAIAFGNVTVAPSTNLVNGNTVSVSLKNFGTDKGPFFVVECTNQIVSTQDIGYCDNSTPSPTNPTAPNHVTIIDATVVGGIPDTTPGSGTDATPGSATGTFTIHTGANFLSSKGKACSYANNLGSCEIVVTDGPTAATTTYAGFASVTFKDTRAKTTTKAKSSKSSVVAKKKVTITSTTKKTGTAALSGKVIFSDNGKKFASVAEKASGKVTAKLTVKKGKNKITAVYSGNATYKPSTGKVTVTGKK